MKLVQTTHPLVSFVVACQKHDNLFERTMARVEQCGLRPNQIEVVLVETSEANPNNADILKMARGQYLVFLKENTYPQTGAIQRMIGHFESEARLGAAVFMLQRSDGSQRGGAYPGLVCGRGTGLRRDALERIGEVNGDWSEAQTEFDVSLRLLATGWDVRACDDLLIIEAGPAGDETSGFQAIRDNVAMTARYFPRGWVLPYVREIMSRQRLTGGAMAARWLGAARGMADTLGPGRRQPICGRVFEQLVHLEEIERRLRRAQDRWRLRKILFVDVGRNFLAYRRAAAQCGIAVAGIAESRLGGRGMLYKGLRILGDQEAMKLSFDAAVVSNLDPVEAARRRDDWRQFDRRPVIDLFEDDALAIRPYAAPIRLVTSGEPGVPTSVSEARRTVARSA